MKYIVEHRTVDISRRLIEAETEEGAMQIWYNGGEPTIEESTQRLETTKVEIVSSLVQAESIPA